MPPRRFLAPVALTLVATSLYAYQLARDWPAQSARLQTFLAADTPVQIQPAALQNALRYVTGSDYEIEWGNDGSPAWALRRTLAVVVSGTLAVIVLAGVVRALWRVAARAPDAPFWLAALLWWVVPIAALTATRFPPHIVYLLLSVPAGFVLAAPILNSLTRRSMTVAVAAVLVASSFGLLHAARVQIAAHPAGIGLDTLSIRAVIPFQLTGRRLADEYGVSEFYTTLSPASLTAKVGREINTVSWFDLPQFEIFKVDQPAIYVRWERGRPAAALPLAERAATLEYPGDDFVAFDVVPAYRRDELSALAANVVEWPTAEGLTLVGYDLSPAFDELTVYWVVDALADERFGWILAPFAHLINTRGELAANVGAPGLPGYLYRLGDVYRYVISVPPLPPGDYTLELGLYDGLHSRGVTFLPPGEAPRPVYTARLTIR